MTLVLKDLIFAKGRESRIKIKGIGMKLWMQPTPNEKFDMREEGKKPIQRTAMNDKAADSTIVKRRPPTLSVTFSDVSMHPSTSYCYDVIELIRFSIIIFRKFKAKAVEEGMKLGEAITQAMEMWVKQRAAEPAWVFSR